MEARRRSDPRAGAHRTTARHLPAPTATPGGRFHLLVIGDDLYATHPLPDAGAIAIGRSPSCEVFIDHPSVSRRHAVLHLGPPLAIED
ncbi:MAG TPA: FHA domain-containing protein, partial [Kofleriaceae bacterium]|nr:FHA domain-containing protein [Kofleriaceae bacterium]